MDLSNFLKDITSLGWRVVSFNTYTLNNKQYCYMMLAEKGNNGYFIKEECEIFLVDSMLLNLYMKVMEEYYKKRVDIH